MQASSCDKRRFEVESTKIRHFTEYHGNTFYTIRLSITHRTHLFFPESQEKAYSEDDSEGVGNRRITKNKGGYRGRSAAEDRRCHSTRCGFPHREIEGRRPHLNGSCRCRKGQRLHIEVRYFRRAIFAFLFCLDIFMCVQSTLVIKRT